MMRYGKWYHFLSSCYWWTTCFPACILALITMWQVQDNISDALLLNKMLCSVSFYTYTHGERNWSTFTRAGYYPITSFNYCHKFSVMKTNLANLKCKLFHSITVAMSIKIHFQSLYHCQLELISEYLNFSVEVNYNFPYITRSGQGLEK